MKEKYVVAIDGPAASGKSTTAKVLAKKLKYIYIDSGAMYRACALYALENKVKLDDLDSLARLLDKIEIVIKYSDSGNRILLNDRDVSERIREADITKLSSEIAVIGIVRKKMVEMQREIGKTGGVIMDGRDIGTVVFPDADFKFFLVASVAERAQRRWLEARDKGEDLSLEEIEKELVWRDRNDTNRLLAPLKKADDAIEIDTTDKSIEQQVALLLNIIEERNDNDL